MTAGLEIPDMIEAIQDAIVIVDGSGRIAYINNRFETLFGYQRSQLLEREIEVLIPDWLRAHAGPAGERQDLIALRGDGSAFPAEISLNPFVTSDGRLLAASVVDVTERRKADERLQFLQALVDGARDYGIFMLDPEGHVLSWSAGAELIEGYPASEILGKHFSIFYTADAIGTGHPEYEFRMALANGKFEEEGWRVRKDGSLFWASVLITAVLDNSGKLHGFSKLTRDITERKRSEERLRENEREIRRLLIEAAAQKFHSALDALQDAVVIVDHSGKIAHVNNQVETLFGYETKDLVGQEIEILIPNRFRGGHPGHRQGFFAHPHTKRMAEGLELYALRRDGSEFPAEIRLGPVHTNEGIVAAASIRDITERRKTDERFQLVVEAAPNAMIMAGTDGLITLVNTQAEKLFGYGRGELLGQPMEMLVPERFGGDDRSEFFSAPSMRSTFAGREPFGLRKDGSEMPVEIGLNPIVTADGEFVLASVIDITERKRIAAELQSRAAEMERLIYTVSHDLKSPLITIKSYVAMIDQDVVAGSTDRARADLRRVAKAADKMYQLLEDLLALSRVGRVEHLPESVAFGLLVEEALELAAGGIRARHVHVEVAPDLPEVTVDHRRMVEVMQNLIDNASKFMGSQKEPEIRIGASGDEAETRFFVKDNGVGVEARHHQRIFGLFDKLDPKSVGSGAGLAIVKRIIETHGGRIWIESAGIDGGGSTLWFTLNGGEK